jgi:outer membrane protein TolC
MDRSLFSTIRFAPRPDLRHAAAWILLGFCACRGPAEGRFDREPILPAEHAQGLALGASSDPSFEAAATDFSSAGTVSLEQVLDFARTRNPGLEAQRQGALSLQQSARASGAMPEPTVSWTEFFSEVETRVGPQERRFDVSQKLPWFGALEAKIDAADATARAATASTETKQRELFSRIESLLWKRRLFRESAELELEHIALFESISASIDGRYRTGKAEYADLLRSRSEIERARELRDSALDGVERADALLRRELALTPGAQVPRVRLIGTLPDHFGDTQARTNAAIASNPNLLRLGHLEEAAKQKLNQVDYERKPDLTLGAFLIDTGLSDNPLTPGSGNDATGIKLSLTLPIRQGTYDAMERSARHQVRALRNQREDMLLAIQGEVASSLEDFQAAQRRLDLIARSLLPRAQEVLDTTRAGYASDRSTYLDLVSAGNSLVGLEIELLRAKVDRELARIAIELHLGRNLDLPNATKPSAER